MKWGLKEVREHEKRLFGKDHLRTVNQCLRIIGDPRDLSRYHFNEVRNGIRKPRLGSLLVCRPGCFDALRVGFPMCHAVARPCYSHLTHATQTPHDHHDHPPA